MSSSVKRKAIDGDSADGVPSAAAAKRTIHCSSDWSGSSTLIDNRINPVQQVRIVNLCLNRVFEDDNLVNIILGDYQGILETDVKQRIRNITLFERHIHEYMQELNDFALYYADNVFILGVIIDQLRIKFELLDPGDDFDHIFITTVLGNLFNSVQARPLDLIQNFFRFLFCFLGDAVNVEGQPHALSDWQQWYFEQLVSLGVVDFLLETGSDIIMMHYEQPGELLARIELYSNTSILRRFLQLVIVYTQHIATDKTRLPQLEACVSRLLIVAAMQSVAIAVARGNEEAARDDGEEDLGFDGDVA
ncbi:hypothetical protein MPSEU_000340300 [Mayamaea pseudoterrestris]|nr:hypothetical protein MPSEU_000340300 [Mayamaea pseudoterrestris]